jgi:hypothetical protein
MANDSFGIGQFGSFHSTATATSTASPGPVHVTTPTPSTDVWPGFQKALTASWRVLDSHIPLARFSVSISIISLKLYASAK